MGLVLWALYYTNPKLEIFEKKISFIIFFNCIIERIRITQFSQIMKYMKANFIVNKIFHLFESSASKTKPRLHQNQQKQSGKHHIIIRWWYKYNKMAFCVKKYIYTI